MELSTSVSIASLLLTAASIVWIGGYRMSAVIHEVKTLRVDMQKLEIRLDNKIDKLEDRMEKGFEKIDRRFEKMERRFEKMEGKFEKLENKMEGIQTESHKMDIRVTTIEQLKS